MIRALASLIILSAGAYAQTLTITAPAAGTPTISGIAHNFTSACSSCPSLYSVEYVIDNESGGNGGGAAFRASGYALPWNTNLAANGTHFVVAIARDAANVTIATSSATPFIVDNTSTYHDGSGAYNAQLSVTPSCTSNCSGAITFTLNATGTWSNSEGWNWAAYVDGDPVTFSPGGSASAPSTTALIDTRSFYDGSHNIKITLFQGTPGAPQFLGEWQQAITFQNGSSVPVALNANYREIFLTPSGNSGNCGGGSTCTLSGTLYNANGSAVSSPTLLYYSLNTAVATVNQTTGVVTIASGVPLPNSAQIMVMSSVASLSMQVDGSNGIVIGSGPYQQSYVGQGVKVTGGTGCTPGFYYFVQATTTAGVLNAAPGTNGSVCTGVTGPSRFVWVFANAQNTLPHFSRNGSALTAYSPTASMWHASTFNYDFGNVEATSLGAGLAFWPAYAAVWNTLEVGLTDCLPGNIWSGSAIGTLNPGNCATSTSQSAWQTDVQNYVASLAILGSTYGLYMHLIGTPWFNGDPPMFSTTQGLGAGGASGGWTAPYAVQYAYSQWAAQNTCTPSSSQHCYGSAIGDTRDDEVNSAWNIMPLAGQIKFGTNGLSQIVCNGTTCDAYQTGWANYYETGDNFIISGATTSGFNSASPNVYTATNVSANEFSFPSTVASGAYNSTTDPGLTLQQFGYAWHSGGATSNYNLYNIFSQIVSWIAAAGSHAPLGIFTPSGLSNNAGTAAWSNASIAGYNEIYCSNASSAHLDYSPAQVSLFDIIYNQGDQCMRPKAAAIQDGLPTLLEAGAPTTDYAFGGRNVTISMIANGLVTTSGAHGLYNVFPGVTRAQISGSSNSAYNADFLIQTTPTASALNIYGGTAVVSTAASSGTITFSNGHAYTVSIQNLPSPMTQQMNVNDVTYSCAVPKNRGLTFTISGTGTAWDNSGTYYYPFNNDTDASCNETFLSLDFFLVPSGTSTGGTISIIATNLPTRGISIMSGLTGPRAEYVSHAESAIVGPGVAGTRTYLGGINPQAFNPATGGFSGLAQAYNARYNDYSDYAAGNVVQQGPLYYINVGGSTDAWYAIAQQNIMANRMTKYLLQPHLASPDYGQGYEAAARAGSYGNLLVIQSFWNASRTLAVNLSPYLISGQNILKYYCTYLDCAVTVLDAGTTSDTVPFDPGGTVWYVFSDNEAAELNEPTLSVRLADVSGATDVVVRYAYEPYPLNNPQGSGLVNAANLSSGSGMFPVDRHIGPIYYRILFLKANGEVLAMSDIQQL